MPQLNGWLIYKKEDYEKNAVFAQRFLDLGNHDKSSLKLVYHDDIFYGSVYNTLCLLDGEGNRIETPDFVINRAIDPLLSKQLELLGIRVFNSSRVARICNDKARTYQEISLLGLPMVDTLFVDRQALLNKELPLSGPVVIKSVEGRGGKEVFLAYSNDELRRIVQDIPKERFVVQKLCGSPGRDVRVFIVGKTIAGAILRRSRGDFKANFSLGGTAEPYVLTDSQKELVMRIVNHFDFGMVGIDFIFDEKGDFLFNEIEDVAGSRTLSMTSDVDIVKQYLKHVYGYFGL